MKVVRGCLWALVAGLVLATWWGADKYVVRNVGLSMSGRHYLCQDVAPTHVLPVGQVVLVWWPERVKTALAGVIAPAALEMASAKRVVAGPGDQVCWEETATDAQLWINGHLAAEVLPQGLIELPHPVGCQTVAADEVAVLGEHPLSIDSRYCGPLPRAQVQAQCWKVWVPFD
jgi:type IV secretory pathway protease TraF